ncbi:MAG TPA: endonuclease/exonuclease/phosphatase family protein [Kofleriaceae bacterium]|nr:endonuclease/exonuclease/phosphatase family protein [Kofleriaceae bacterium]
MTARAACAACTVMTLAACDVELGPSQPWQSIDQLRAPMQAERAAPGAMGSARPASADPLRVVTYNTEYGQDPQGIADAILGDPALARAGVFLFQEEESYPEEGRSRAAQLASLLGLGYVYVPARTKGDGTHGLAVMSAYPLEAIEKMDLPLADNGVQRIAVAADVHIGDQILHIIDVHLETRLNPRDRIAQLHPAVIGAADAVLVAGDFNTNWMTWAGGVPVLAAERDQAPIVDSYMTSLGFSLSSAGSGPTEHAYGLEFRLDSIYTRSLDVTFGGVVRTGPSDHWPMFIDVRL